MKNEAQALGCYRDFAATPQRKNQNRNYQYLRQISYKILKTNKLIFNNSGKVNKM
jgi:hypothetical protein